MPKKLKPYLWVLVFLVAVPGIFVAGTWIRFLLAETPFHYAWVQGAWPLACSTRGCITTADWARQFEVAKRFAVFTGGAAQTPAQALTSALRQHLLSHAFFKSPVTVADAKRYRQEILNVQRTDFLETNLGMSAEEYDQYVILPFLEQQALMGQYKAESTEELYKLLSQERFLVLFTWHYRWDRATGSIL
ncbi:MAG: hypothetical protein HYZ62_01180 [Candidatus Andersenbacteria bacterium]|nr:hypothetical protein [Candidatus Andersenbacteria bacterium]